MSVSDVRTRYIPFRKKDIINMLLNENSLGRTVEDESLMNFCHMIESILHFEFHKELEELKDIYYPVNPDLKGKAEISESEIHNVNEQLLKVLRKVLNDANYDVISKEEIEQAYENSALIGVSVNIDLSAYEFIEVYARGHRTDGAIDEEQLDGEIENWFEQKYKCTLDFECSDALVKLRKFRLLSENTVENQKIIISVIPISEALKVLDYRWDNYFTFNQRSEDEIH